MTTFEEREKAYENAFVREQELRFKAQARANRMLGLWAAKRLGLGDAEAEVYAKTVVLADFEDPGDGDVFRKVRTDLTEAGDAISDAEIRKAMAACLERAIEQVSGPSGAAPAQGRSVLGPDTGR